MHKTCLKNHSFEIYISKSSKKALTMYKTITTLNEIPSDAVVFKHSLTCPISANAKREMDEFAQNHEVLLLIVQESQELKMQVAQKYNVQHESPQVLVIKNGSASKIFNHWGVTKQAVEDAYNT